MTSEAEKKKKREKMEVKKNIRFGMKVIDILGLPCVCGFRKGRVEFAFPETDEISLDLFKKWIEKIFIVKAIEEADVPAMPDNAPPVSLCSSDSSSVEVKEGQVAVEGSRYNYISLQQAAFDRLVDYALWLELETHNKIQRETEPIFNISDVTFVLLMVFGGALMATGFAFFPGLFLVTLGGLGFAGSVFLSGKPALITQDVVSIGKTDIDKLYEKHKQVTEAIDRFSLLDIYDKSNLDYCGFEYELGKEGKEECIKLFFENNLEQEYFKEAWFPGIDPKIQYKVEENKGKYVIELEGESCDKFINALNELQTQKLDAKAAIHMASAKLVRAVAVLLTIGGVVLTFIAPALGLQMTVVSGLLLGGAYWVVGPSVKGNSDISGEAKPTESKICGWLKKLHIDEVNFMRFSIVFAALSIVAGAALIATGFGLATGVPMLIFGIASLPGPALFIRNARVISDTNSVKKRSSSFSGKTRPSVVAASVSASAVPAAAPIFAPAPIPVSSQSVSQLCDNTSSTRARSNSVPVFPACSNSLPISSSPSEEQTKLDTDEVNCRPLAESDSPGSSLFAFSTKEDANTKHRSCIFAPTSRPQQSTMQHTIKVH